MIDLHALHPVEFPGLVRMGNATGDGGYVMPPDLVREATMVFSLGLGTDWTFDEDVRRMNPRARLIGVDHTIHASDFFRSFVRAGIKRMVYRLLRDREKAMKYDRALELAKRYFALFANPNEHLEKMVGAGSGKEMVSIDALMRMAGRDADGSAILKMDIEGSEYEVIPAIVAHADKITVIAAEFHDLDRDPARFNEAIAALRTAYVVVHIHGNNCGIWSSEINFPETVEITFVRRDRVPEPLVPAGGPFPRVGLDVPNDPDREDYVLPFPGQQ